METLNQVLKVLFEETRSEDVIDAYLDKRVKYVGIGRFVDERIFCQQMVRVNMAHTLDQAEVLYHVLSDKWSKEDTCVHELLYCKESNVFNVLATTKCISSIICRYASIKSCFLGMR